MKQQNCDIEGGVNKTIDWMLTDENGKPVCNFIPSVQTVIETRYDTKVKNFVKLSLEFTNSEAKEVLVLLENLEKIDWSSVYERCVINSCNRNAKGFVANIIRSNLYKVSHEIRFGVERTGIHRMDDMVFFCTGKDIIMREGKEELKNKIWLEDIPCVLDVALEMTPKESFEGMRELISLSPETGIILVAHTIAGIIREAYEVVGFNPCTILEIVGESGMFKSSYVPQLVQLYNRKTGVRPATRFNSTHRYMEDLLCSYNDCTIIIDDLHTAQTTEIKRKNEATAEEIIRRISDNMGQGHRKGNAMVQKKFRANLVLIGEYTIGQESTVARMLVVNLTKRPNGKILDKYQREKNLLASTFYYYFIFWYVNHYEEIVIGINKRLTEFRTNTVETNIHGRLLDTKFYLETSFLILLKFCQESDFLTTDVTRKIFRKFVARVDELIQAQQARIKSDGRKQKKVNYLSVLRKLYKSNKFSLANSAETFNLEKHDGLIYYQCLCIRRKSLEKIIGEYFPGITVDEVVRKLVAEDALKLVGDKRTVKISTLNKEVGSIRFYAIWLHALEEKS